MIWELGFLCWLWDFVSWAAWLPLGRWAPGQVWCSLLSPSVASQCSLHTHILWSDFLNFPSLLPTMVPPGRRITAQACPGLFPPCPLGLGPLCPSLMIPAKCGLLSSYPLIFKFAKLMPDSGPLHLPFPLLGMASSRCPPGLLPHLFCGSMPAP